jgi:phosphoserine phosphatase
MNFVVTLIAPAKGDLTRPIFERAYDQLRAGGGAIDKHDWLSDGEACDLYYSGADAHDIASILRECLSDTKLDMAVQPVAGRRKKLLLADMDSTMVTVETLDELAEYAGLKKEISEITERAMNGEILFRDALTQRMALLTGLDADTMAKTMERINYSPGAKTLVRTMSAGGAYTALASGGFRYFTGRVKQALGFDFEIGNEIEIEDGKFTGNVVGDIVTKAVKRETLIELSAQQGIDLSETLAVGDGANDLPMLEEAGTGVAYHAHAIVIASAPFRIDHAGLDALLFLQGYRRSEFVG